MEKAERSCSSPIAAATSAAVVAPPKAAPQGADHHRLHEDTGGSIQQPSTTPPSELLLPLDSDTGAEGQTGQLQGHREKNCNNVTAFSQRSTKQRLIGAENRRRGRGARLPEDELRDKESARDCVEKKKEIFLVQMAVDIRKAEILKLHDKAARKEEALRAADQQLVKEMQKFDEFLRATDQHAQAAMKEADEVGRVKLEKQQTIKELQETLARCTARISAYEELVQEGAAYKEFLEKLSPREWLEEQEEKRAGETALRRKKWVQKQLELQEQRLKAEMQQIDKETAEDIAEYEEKKVKGHKYLEDGRRDFEEKAERKKKLLKRKMLTAADFQAAFHDEEADDQFSLYFKQPQQLLDIVKHLEEQNLFLIQNTQDNEAALEDVVSKFEETKHQTEERTKALEGTIMQLQQQVQRQKQVCAQLQKTLMKENTEKEEKRTYQQLTSKIAELHAICGYEDDAATEAICRLEQIEAKMEDYLAILAKYETENPELIARLERAKEKERRERARQAKLNEQAQKSDERLQASLKRSQKLISHRRGKPIMFRSPPFVQQRQAPQAVVDDARAEQEFRMFFC